MHPEEIKRRHLDKTVTAAATLRKSKIWFKVSPCAQRLDGRCYRHSCPRPARKSSPPNAGSPLNGPQASKPTLEKWVSQTTHNHWGAMTSGLNPPPPPAVNSYILPSKLYCAAPSDYMGLRTMVYCLSPLNWNRNS